MFILEMNPTQTEIGCIICFHTPTFQIIMMIGPISEPQTNKVHARVPGRGGHSPLFSFNYPIISIDVSKTNIKIEIEFQ